MEIDVNLVPASQLFIYYTKSCPDENLRSLVHLLPLVCSDKQIEDILVQVRDGKSSLMAVYEGKDAPPKSTLLGAIDDGALYLISK